MEGAGFRSLIIFLLLAVLAFIAGSLASESSVGALAPTAAVLGLFFLLYLGKNCWILVFLVPPVLEVLGISMLRNFPISYVVCDVVFFYMIILYMMGYIKMRWNGVFVVDIFVLLFLVYFASTYIRHPVKVKVFTEITDFGYAMVGGKEYIYCAALSLCYITLSLVSVNFKTLKNVLKWAFYLTLVGISFATVKGVLLGSITLGEEVSNSRFGAFSAFGSIISRYIFAKYSLLGIILSPTKLLLVIVSVGCIILSGFRSLLISIAIYSFGAAYMHKQALLYILMILTTWGSMVYLSNENEHLFDEVPHGIQRAISVLPGVVVSKRAENAAKGSSEWRLVMWKWAFDPSTGYIKDYVWGDGYGLSLYEEKLRDTAVSLGLVKSGDVRLFAERGLWHNGAIECVHRLGFVGLAVMYIYGIVAVGFAIRVCIILRPFEGREYFYVLFIPIFERLIVIWFLPAATIGYITMLYPVAICKLTYLCIKREYPEYIKARTGKYVPLIVDEYRHTNSVA